ncbi:MAG: 3-deoxy-D-manno-octulosonic acid transferase [Rhodospirillaceae bacterium]|nr:3-deoxy-D-manno-octulosonic acid transferase [Rhodospirillaceae bacterium]|tara:strand:+ start:16013 stop:17305 length:1293 start_codon:yes stop_codon:yes gene_type:complete
MTNYPIGILIYKFFCFSFFPLISNFYVIRKFKGKEDANRFIERKGIASIERPSGKLVWAHCASVGEIQSALPLINKLNKKIDANFLITTGTISSYQAIKNKIPKGVYHQYIPIDLNKYNKKFLNYWEPDLVLWFESELWPNILLLLQKRNIKHLIINARMSEKSFQKWKYFPRTLNKILSGFDLCIAQSREDSLKFKFFGTENVIDLVNIKYFSPKLNVDLDQLNLLTNLFKGRNVWLAASTHEGEESVVAEIHVNLSKKIPNLLTIIAPRHPNRKKSIERMLKSKKVEFTTRSEGNVPNTNTDIYLADSIGEMGLWYSICKIVFLGKSIIGKGGQNPIEPSLFGCAVICGNNVENFSEVVNDLLDVEGIIKVNSIEDIQNEVFMLLSNLSYADEIGIRAKNFVINQSRLIDKFFNTIMPEIAKCQIKLK